MLSQNYKSICKEGFTITDEVIDISGMDHEQIFTVACSSEILPESFWEKVQVAGSQSKRLRNWQ